MFNSLEAILTMIAVGYVTNLILIRKGALLICNQVSMDRYRSPVGQPPPSSND